MGLDPMDVAAVLAATPPAMSGALRGSRRPGDVALPNWAVDSSDKLRPTNEPFSPGRADPGSFRTTVRIAARGYSIRWGARLGSTLRPVFLTLNRADNWANASCGAPRLGAHRYRSWAIAGSAWKLLPPDDHRRVLAVVRVLKR